MNAFHFLEYLAWALSALLGGWILFDMVKTDRTYSEDLLLSSKEGEIEDSLIIDPSHQGGTQ